MRMARRMSAALAACAAVLAGAAGLRADDPKPDRMMKPALERKALDIAVYGVLRDVINRGADLYNPPTSDWNGCYRLYEGALLTLKPLLDHRPDLQKAIDTGLQSANRSPNLANRAFDLRAVIDRIRDDVNPNPKKVPLAKTLWDRLGGEANVKKVVHDFVVKAAADPKVDFTRGGKFPVDDIGKLEKRLVEFVSMAAGGPLKYTGRSMKEVHKGMMITDAQLDASAAILKDALEKNGAKPDDVKAVLDAVGGTRKDIVEKKADAPKDQTLWDRLGGEANVKKVVHDFVVKAAADPKVDFTRGGKFPLDDAGVAKLETRLVEFVSMAAGGPLKYTGRSMKESHKGMMITDAQFDASAAILKDALEKNGAKPDDVKAVLDAVGGTRKDIVEKKPESIKDQTLWERLGGEANVKKVVNDFVAKAATDPKVDFFRGGKYKPDAAAVARLKKLLVEFVSAATGGPLKYTGKSMKESHKGMMITDAQFDAAAADLKEALEKNGAKPDDVKAVLAAIGGTRKDIVEKKEGAE